MLWRPTFVLLLAQLIIATPLARRWNDFAEKHSWVGVPKGWELYSEAPSDYTFDLRIGLRQGGMDDLIGHLTEISDPTHARYGQHLTKEETEALVRPRPETTELVEMWFEAHGLTNDDVVHRTGGGDWITVRVSVALAERMLGTKYNVYHHRGSNEMVVRTLSYALPRDLHSHIDTVAPTTYFSTLKSMRSTSFLHPVVEEVEGFVAGPDDGAFVPPSCSSKITPACLQALYKTAGYKPAATDRNEIGVVGYLDEFAYVVHVQFFATFRPDAASEANFTTVSVHGGGDDQNRPGSEANLDIQYTASLTFPTPNIYWSVGGSPPFIPDSNTVNNTNEPYLDWLNYVLGSYEIPSVITTSYGDDEQTIPQDYAISVCNKLAELTSRGVTVFFSSGDFGVGGGDCHTNDGKNQTIFQPMFPASCPFVTAVGGTTKVNPEVAVSFSGGGFSRYFDAPSYQSKAVAGYLGQLKSTNQGLFNSKGRAYPDLAAQGDNFQIVVGQRVINIGGTSASGPTVASIFTLLNDARIANGKSPLGFINPLIYSTATSGFNDIVSGSNPGCNTSGFPASSGWDPVTGLGTPDFEKLRAIIG
ncbi:Tripeptidyl-peptidase SED2 [Leucoagaricus sp. SymC.cos]|nr:Tripeptidyl-peptidase SED2 [Leucoagaricus sp. SymC.cos]